MSEQTENECPDCAIESELGYANIQISALKSDVAALRRQVDVLCWLHTACTHCLDCTVWDCPRIKRDDFVTPRECVQHVKEWSAAKAKEGAK